jgi:hypothetical protein
MDRSKSECVPRKNYIPEDVWREKGEVRESFYSLARKEGRMMLGQ